MYKMKTLNVINPLRYRYNYQKLQIKTKHTINNNHISKDPIKSFHKRPLPSSLISLSSIQGIKIYYFPDRLIVISKDIKNILIYILIYEC